MAGERKQYLVGLDCGTSVIKAAAFDADGNEIAVAQAGLANESPAPGRMEYRAEDLWAAAAGALRALWAAGKVAPEAVAAVGPTGAGNGALLVDARGAPVRNGILALDNRTAAAIAAEADSPLPGRVRAINGQATWTGQSFRVLRWLREEEPAALARAARVFVIKDYVKWRLTDAYVADASEQSKLGLLDIFRGECTAELLALYDLEELLPKLAPIRPSGAVIGTVTATAAAATGLRAGTPVVNGLADIDASALGSGAVRAGQMSMVAGTWSINQLFVDRLAIDARLFGLSHYAVEGVYEQLEASASSTANLTWFVKQACADLAATAKERGISVYALIDGLVAAVPPASTEVFFHPYLYGSNTKGNARAGFYGLAGWQGKVELLAALFEGVVFSHNDHVTKLRAVGQPVTDIRLSGGAARSEVWTQMFADVLGVPVLVPAVSEGGALGAAICAAVGAGLYDSLPAAAARMVRVAREHRPNAALAAAYAERFAAYRRVTELMGPVWDELDRVYRKTH